MSEPIQLTYAQKKYLLGMYIIVSMVGAAETIIGGTADKAADNRAEDGQFAVFLPLSEEQERKITDSGVTLEKLFSFDLDMRIFLFRGFRRRTLCIS